MWLERHAFPLTFCIFLASGLQRLPRRWKQNSRQLWINLHSLVGLSCRVAPAAHGCVGFPKRQTVNHQVVYYSCSTVTELKSQPTMNDTTRCRSAKARGGFLPKWALGQAEKHDSIHVNRKRVLVMLELQEHSKQKSTWANLEKVLDFVT